MEFSVIPCDDETSVGDLWCTCKDPSRGGDFFVQCSHGAKCNGWVHLDCVGLLEKDIPAEGESYTCPACQASIALDTSTDSEATISYREVDAGHSPCLPATPIPDNLADLFVEGKIGTQGKGASVKCGTYIKALHAKPVRTVDVLTVYARHLRVQGILEDAESTYPEGHTSWFAFKPHIPRCCFLRLTAFKTHVVLIW